MQYLHYVSHYNTLYYTSGSKKNDIFVFLIGTGSYASTSGIDPGYKTWLAIVRRSKNGNETNIKISHGQYYVGINHHSRKKKREKMTKKFEKAAAKDREDNYKDVVTPNGMYTQSFIVAFFTDINCALNRSHSNVRMSIDY